MFRGRDTKKRTRRKPELGVERLDDRVVLSAGGTHQAATAVAARAVASHPTSTNHPAVVARFETAVNHLESRFQSGYDHLSSRIAQRIDHFDAMYKSAVSRATGQIRSGATPAAVRKADASLMRSGAAITNDLKRFTANVNRQWNSAGRSLNQRLDQLGRREVKADPALKTTVDMLKANFSAVESASKNLFDSELQTARTDLQNSVHSVNGAMASVRTAATAAGFSDPSTTAASAALSTAYQGLTTGLTAGLPQAGSSASLVGIIIPGVGTSGAANSGLPLGLFASTTLLGLPASYLTGNAAGSDVGATGLGATGAGTVGLGFNGIGTTNLGAAGLPLGVLPTTTLLGLPTSYLTTDLPDEDLGTTGVGETGAGTVGQGSGGIGTTGVGVNGFGSAGLSASGLPVGLFPTTTLLGLPVYYVTTPTTSSGTTGSTSNGLGTNLFTTSISGALGSATSGLGVGTTSTAGLAPLTGSMMTGLGSGTTSTAGVAPFTGSTNGLGAASSASGLTP